MEHNSQQLTAQDTSSGDLCGANLISFWKTEHILKLSNIFCQAATNAIIFLSNFHILIYRWQIFLVHFETIVYSASKDREIALKSKSKHNCFTGITRQIRAKFN